MMPIPMLKVRCAFPGCCEWCYGYDDHTEPLWFCNLHFPLEIRR